MARASTTAILLTSMALAACYATSPKPPGYEDAARAARLNFSAPGGPHYMRAVKKQMGKDFKEIVRLCFLQFPDTRGVALLFRLSSSGAPLETIVYPDSELGSCIREKLDCFPLPPPPTPDYWIDLGVAAAGPLQPLGP